SDVGGASSALDQLIEQLGGKIGLRLLVRILFLHDGPSSFKEAPFGSNTKFLTHPRPAISEHHSAALRRASSRSRNSSPANQLSRTKGTWFSTLGLSLGLPIRVGSTKIPRA